MTSEQRAFLYALVIMCTVGALLALFVIFVSGQIGALSG